MRETYRTNFVRKGGYAFAIGGYALTMTMWSNWQWQSCPLWPKKVFVKMVNHGRNSFRSLRRLFILNNNNLNFQTMLFSCRQFETNFINQL